MSETDDFPPLPEPAILGMLYPDHPGWECPHLFTADQMNAYVLADRAARAAPVASSEDMYVVWLLGYKQGKDEATPPAAPAPQRSTGWVAKRDHYAVPVLFNPYTGEPRDMRDVHSDPQGILIAPPGAQMLAAKPAQPAELVAMNNCTGCVNENVIGGPCRTCVGSSNRVEWEAPAQPAPSIGAMLDTIERNDHIPMAPGQAVKQAMQPAQQPLTDRLRAAVAEVMQHQFTHNRRAMTALQELIDAADAVVLAAQEGK
jgi:hypothetical protein